MSEQVSAPRGALYWVGWVMTGLVSAFLLFSSVIKLIGHPSVPETMSQLGWPLEHGLTIGIIELVCVLLYLFPPTAVLGAVLETALLGGAVATHLRVGSPMFSHTLFGVYIGLWVWGGLFFRDPRLRALLPLRR
jgi:hypothetical protein